MAISNIREHESGNAPAIVAKQRQQTRQEANHKKAEVEWVPLGKRPAEGART